MTRLKFMCSTACVALLAGNAALADVTPEQVWENWKTLSTSYGQTMTTGSEAREGDTLVIRGIDLTSKNEGAEAVMHLDEVRLKEQGDGTVEMTMSETSSMTVKTEAEGEVPATTTGLTIATPGMRVIVSGTPEETRYDFTGSSVKASLSGIEGPKDVPEDLKLEATLRGLSGNYLVSGTTDLVVTSNLAADSLGIVISGTDTADNSKVDVKADMTALTGQSTSRMTGGVADDFLAALKAGSAMEGSFAYAGGTMDMKVDGAEGPMQISASNTGGSLSFAMDASRLAYGAGAKDARVTVSGAQIPFPQVNFGYKEGAFNLVMPVSRADAPADFAFLTKLVGLTVSDEIWGMLDPTAQLPRDPMNVVLDTKGKVTLNVNLLDEAEMAALGEGAPGEINALDINELQVTAAGAEVTGSGALTFDNSDMETYGGVPAPTGQIDLKAVGVNALLDKLMAMGLVPEDQMMGTRMMLGMFAKVDPSAPDTMTSTLEFKDKHFFANGMQLQ
ncbi:DUF2125 domain-containing protein [Gemmobacter sp. LW-1]|uniref:DUF2125 domain-containing protein n=1 Tax=Gemmobacter sp. LW-1 TaxID=1529005 RepID=UPI0006C75BA7|nr:DUF2125 domain-containing protein [Gemmobacter sp. LW-1]